MWSAVGYAARSFEVSARAGVSWVLGCFDAIDFISVIVAVARMTKKNCD
jgi:hypothetical protein